MIPHIATVEEYVYIRQTMRQSIDDKLLEIDSNTKGAEYMDVLIKLNKILDEMIHELEF